MEFLLRHTLATHRSAKYGVLLYDSFSAPGKNNVLPSYLNKNTWSVGLSTWIFENLLAAVIQSSENLSKKPLFVIFLVNYAVC